MGKVGFRGEKIFANAIDEQKKQSSTGTNLINLSTLNLMTREFFNTISAVLVRPTLTSSPETRKQLNCAGERVCK
jgi:hypothetical protein